MMEVSLRDILNAREARVRRQQALLIEYRVPLFCFTMNIAGPVKTTPLIERVFCVGLEMLDSRLPQENILFREIRMLPTGCEANYAISIPASKLKLLYIGLPHFQQFLADGFSENDAGAYTLLHLIANVADTNLYKRGGEAGTQWAAKAARELLSATKYPSIQQIEALDDGFIARTLSPGGCADLLAATCFLQKLAQ